MAPKSLDDEPTPVVRNACPGCGIEATPVMDMPLPTKADLKSDTFHRFCVMSPWWWTCARFRKGGFTLDRRG
ncbi:MAG TPA: hypothetical protein VMS92_22890 [Mycobacterium sp.]|nr:hypothetical protein [Mycobacterium sp.]